MYRGRRERRLPPMDPMLYFSVFAIALVLCAVAAVMYRPPMRRCPSCGIHTPTQGRYCRHCEYRFA